MTQAIEQKTTLCDRNLNLWILEQHRDKHLKIKKYFPKLLLVLHLAIAIKYGNKLQQVDI
jgi:hypothetical protein